MSISRPLAAALLLAALHMLIFDRGLGGDGWASFSTLESLVEDGDLWVEDDHRGVMNGLVEARPGHLAMQYPPGVLALDVLPFLAGRILDAALPSGWLAGGVELPPAGRVPREVFFSAAFIVLARNLVVLLGMLWIAQALRRTGFPERTSALAASFAFFGGPLIFYSLVGMTHAPVFALGGLLLLLLSRFRQTGDPRLALAAGIVVGSAVLLRYGSVALAAPALLALALGPGGFRVRRWAGFGMGFGLALLPLPLWWRAVFGAWTFPYGGTWEISAASPWNVLFSPVHGLFLFHPALLFAAAGLILAAGREIGRRLPGEGTVAAVWFLAVAVLFGWWSEWENTGGYGQRFLVDALPACALGFAAFLESGRQVWKGAALTAATLFGYLLFFTAVGGLAPPPPGFPWPQRLSDYAPLVRRPPGPGDLWDGLRRASLPARALAGPPESR
ncbi:MAG TPA: hypothetical protein VG477_05865 [Thermoanaerobaculia bacterium]|nr:hypothetical protein [Thermoanaerobaculia bacterium]